MNPTHPRLRATADLGDLVRRKLECLRSLAELGKAQLAQIEVGDMNRLLALLAARQNYLTQLTELEHALGPYRDERPEDRVWASPRARETCAAELAECRQLFQQILAQEIASERALLRRRDESANRLHEFQAGQQARTAYSSDERQGVSQLDLSTQG